MYRDEKAYIPRAYTRMVCGLCQLVKRYGQNLLQKPKTLGACCTINPNPTALSARVCRFADLSTPWNDGAPPVIWRCGDLAPLFFET